MTTVVVAGAIGSKAGNGGEAWVRPSWVLGFRRLGFEVHMVEQLDPAVCSDADGLPVDWGESINGAFFRDVVARFGLSDVATLVVPGVDRAVGLSFAEVRELLGSAGALVNISGNLDLEGLVGAAPLSVYVDLDPVYSQVWHATGRLGGHLGRHDHHVTVGRNVDRLDRLTPGIRWRATAPPVLLEEWPVGDDAPAPVFTTVASWRGPFGPLELDGRALGRKAHEFRRMIPLPGMVEWPMEIALDIDPADQADLDSLRGAGWRVVDPRGVAATPGAFRDYVRGSGAEFSVAQGAYVDTCSGWLSDRTAHYLASGRPALVQDTGAALGRGEGLVTFRTIHEAAAGAARITGDYAVHREAARELAERHFDSDLVLARLAEEVGLAP